MHGVIAIVLSAVSALLDIIGLAIPYWCYISKSGVSAYFGLWQTCGPVPLDPSNTVVCTSFGSGAPSALLGTRALEILGMLLVGVALVAAVLKQFVMKERPILMKLGAACAILGGVLMIIGTVVFATDSGVKLLRDVAGMNLHAGFALCIVAGVFALPAGVVMILNKT